MHAALVDRFLVAGDALRVYEGDQIVFSSTREGLAPLLEYIETSAPHHRQVAILDKIMGNAAALLAIHAHGQEVYSPLGSQLALKTLEKYGIEHHIGKIVPFIQRPDGRGLCPMEELSLNKGPEEFYEAVRSIIKLEWGESMEQIRLGRTNLMVSKLGFGGIPIQRLSEEEAVAVVRCCLELGITYIDTANAYTTSEERIGKALASWPERPILATKSTSHTRDGLAKHLKLSLERLGVDYIDLYQFHGVNDSESLNMVLDPRDPWPW